MTSRAYNFCAGPCTLPLEVLQEAHGELIDYHDTGMALIEMSHRSKLYDEVHTRAMELALGVFGAPDDFSVLFIQGGATLQFAMIPMNLLKDGERAAYVNSGAWAQGAITDGGCHGEVYTAWDGSQCNYSRMPSDDELKLQGNTRYLHITSNETIGGVRFPEWPSVDVPLVGDMSSDYMSRPIPWERFDLVYGGVQKNLGPAGAALVFVRKSILKNTRRDLAHYLRYDIHDGSNSLFNTPPMFIIYMVGKMLQWIKSRGGLVAMEKEAERRADMLYKVIDGSEGYYRCPVEERCRSYMNVVFRLPDEELEAHFVAEAQDKRMFNLKGHRSVGGIRASIYNAMPLEGVKTLAKFMDDFRRRNPRS